MNNYISLIISNDFGCKKCAKKKKKKKKKNIKKNIIKNIKNLF